MCTQCVSVIIPFELVCNLLLGAAPPSSEMGSECVYILNIEMCLVLMDGSLDKKKACDVSGVTHHTPC
jgi:hypothetical protein